MLMFIMHISAVNININKRKKSSNQHCLGVGSIERRHSFKSKSYSLLLAMLPMVLFETIIINLHAIVLNTAQITVVYVACFYEI